MIVGEVWLYTLIDGAKPMLSVSKRREMTTDEIKSIPFDWGAIGFHYRKVNYAFDLINHRLGFNRSEISPATLAKILLAIFSLAREALRLTSVTVTVEQSPTQLEVILALKLQALTIRVNRPNPDDLDDLQAEFDAAMAEQNAAYEETTLRAENGKTLHPNQTNIDKAKIALSNGSVKGVGLEEHGKRLVSKTTETAPIVDVVCHDPSKETFLQFIARETRLLTSRVIERMKKR